jgi:hypothetical protein
MTIQYVRVMYRTERYSKRVVTTRHMYPCSQQSLSFGGCGFQRQTSLAKQQNTSAFSKTKIDICELHSSSLCQFSYTFIECHLIAACGRHHPSNSLPTSNSWAALLKLRNIAVMAWPNEPSEDAITQFMSMAPNVDRAEAAARIKARHGFQSLGNKTDRNRETTIIWRSP